MGGNGNTLFINLSVYNSPKKKLLYKTLLSNWVQTLAMKRYIGAALKYHHLSFKPTLGCGKLGLIPLTDINL